MTKDLYIKTLLSVLLSAFSMVGYGQSAGWNYVMTIEPDNGSTAVPTADASTSRVTIEYYDGLCRPVQQLHKGAGGNGEDIITLTEYDLTGDATHQWLPVGVNGGGEALDYASFKREAYSLYGNDQRPYTMTEYEPMAGGRPANVYRPGKEYRTRAISTDYNVLGSDESTSVRRFIVSGIDENATLSLSGNYSAGTLRCTMTIDEDGNRQKVFTDRNDRVVLERRLMADSSTNDTYRVYDARGLLRYILSPEAVIQISGDGAVDNSIIEKLCYSYDYDLRKRLIEERLPGVAPIYYVYDKMGNLIFSQNGNQRSRSEWSVIKYDNRYRRAIEGRCTMATATRASLQAEYGNSLLTETKTLNDGEYGLLYTNNNGPSGFEALRSYVYDDYSHWTGYVDNAPDEPWLLTEMSRSAMGMQTGGAIIDNGIVFHQAIVYDRRGRVIAECERECYANGEGYARYYTYNHRGVLLSKKTQYLQYMEQEILSSRCVEWRYTHDRGDRITKTEYRIDNGEWKEQSAQSYDCIGRLTTKTLGPGGNNSTRLISYGYDMQGRVNAITSPWYNQRLFYTSNPFDSGAPICYNGNLSASHDTMWEEGNGSTIQSDLKFTHHYDALNRLTSSIDTHSGGDYGETMEYDRNGNIMHITRDYDGSRVQDLAIVRDGNRIVSMYDVSDDDRIGEVPQIPSGDYVSAVSYDANGNITRDDTRNVTSITYHDYLDLPRTIKIGVRENHHRYRPDGVKSYRQDRHTVMTTVASVDSSGNTIYTQKPTTKVTTRNYIGDFIKTGNYTWEVPTDDGHIFIDTRNKIKTHYYYVRDYLGSTRAVVDTAGVLLQTMNYYPSGVPFSRMEQEPVTDRLHTGKPFLDMNGLGYYDNNARFLDILTGGFISRDALAGSYPHLSPYANCANNPLSFIDPDGNRVVFADDMTEEQHRATMEGIHSLSAGGMFQNMYETLEDVEDVITIRYGETVKDTNGNIAPGQFVPNEKGKGGTITFNKDIGLTYAVLAEELYHSYQNITPSFQDMITNIEYEAKFFAIGACFDAGRGYCNMFNKLEGIIDAVYQSSKYGTNLNAYSPINIHLISNDYIKYGQSFSLFYQQNGGDNHYIFPVFLMPERLKNLISK